VTILDNEGPLSVAVYDSWVLEGNDGTTTLQYQLVLNAPPVAGQTVSVTANSIGYGASAADFTALPATVVSFSGQASKIVSVTVKGDLAKEPVEAVLLNLTNAVGVTIEDAVGIGSIVNDD